MSWPGRLADARTTLRARLESRLPEIEHAALARAFAIADPTDADPLYRDGLRASVSTAFAYAMEAIERGEERTPPPPPALLAQARLAARSGIGLDTVLRRYLAGYSILSEFVIAEAADATFGREGLHQVLRGHAALFDHLLATVTEEHRQESAARLASREQRRVERISRLLAGEPLDPSEFDYDFDAHHLGLLASGPGAERVVRKLGSRHDCRLLIVRPDEDTVWAWLGSRRRLDPEDLFVALRPTVETCLCIAAGEPTEGLSGWRLTHRQAAAALPVAQRRRDPIARYADVALLAAALRDDLLAISLRQIFIDPLETVRNGDAALRETLRAFLAAGQNKASAAAALGVNRGTVTHRLQTIEQRLGRSITSCLPLLTAALEIAETPDPAKENSPAPTIRARKVERPDRVPFPLR